MNEPGMARPGADGCAGSRPVIVALDGSTHVSTAALLAGMPGSWTVLARRTDTDSRGQARVLLCLLDDMLTETGRAPADIAAVVTGIGPGTFTGVRIAVATARSLALALEVPVFGVSTLAALASEMVGSLAAEGAALPEWIVPVVDARRGQVFYGLYRLGGDGSVYVRAEAFAACDRGGLRAALPASAGTLIVGDAGLLESESDSAGDTRLQPLEVRAEYLVAGQEMLEEPEGDPTGARLGAWLAGALRESWKAGGGRKAGEPGTPEAVRPIYVRSPDADIHITKMRDPWADVARET